MGAGIDAYNSYSQRGSFHVIQNQMAAALELPHLRRAHSRCAWAGIVDICPDASPIIGPTPVDGLYINCGWGTGGFEATSVRLGACRHGGDRRARTSWPGLTPCRGSSRAR